jgi:hypothetical protein
MDRLHARGRLFNSKKAGLFRAPAFLREGKKVFVLALEFRIPEQFEENIKGI